MPQGPNPVLTDFIVGLVQNDATQSLTIRPPHSSWNIILDAPNVFSALGSPLELGTQDGNSVDIFTASTTATDSGEVSLGSGDQQSTGNSGSATVYTGNAGTGNSGSLGLSTGGATTGNTGGITLSTGSASTGEAGNITLSPGSGSGGNNGNVVINNVNQVLALGLPTADPHVVGALWNSSGVLHISAG